MAASGQVTETALAAFQAALGKDAAEPRARYYLALADAQNGKLHEALDQWIKLENESGADAPWRKSLSAAHRPDGGRPGTRSQESAGPWRRRVRRMNHRSRI